VLVVGMRRCRPLPVILPVPPLHFVLPSSYEALIHRSPFSFARRSFPLMLSFSHLSSTLSPTNSFCRCRTCARAFVPFPPRIPSSCSPAPLPLAPVHDRPSFHDDNVLYTAQPATVHYYFYIFPGRITRGNYYFSFRSLFLFLFISPFRYKILRTD